MPAYSGTVWMEPGFPLQPSGSTELRTVEAATLTTFSKGRLRVAWGQPSQFVSGAVHGPDGVLLPLSQRVGGLSYDHALSADPTHLPPWDGCTVDVPGTWLYGGTWFNHFGHFLTETVTTLWPDVAVDGLVFHPFWFGRDVLPWQAAMLALLGETRTPTIVGPHRLRVERLLVPTRPYLPNGYALPEAVSVWRRMAAAANRDRPGGGARRVFLSRAAHHRALAAAGTPSKRSSPNEAQVDELFRSRGYQVAHAEQLDFADQVRLVADADVVAGVSGSALHLSVFAPPGTRVVEVSDLRARPEPVLTQQILAHACGQPLGFVGYPRGPEGYDVDTLAAGLEELGV